jgi:aminoglycoside phosphotransferase (APT) family kinase protein
MFQPIKFARPGWLAPGPSVTAPLLEGANPVPRFVDLCLASANLQRRVPLHLRDRISAVLWSWADRLAESQQAPCLVHGDLGKQNLLVRREQGQWRVAAVLDWELAVSGSPLADVGPC